MHSFLIHYRIIVWVAFPLPLFLIRHLLLMVYAFSLPFLRLALLSLVHPCFPIFCSWSIIPLLMVYSPLPFSLFPFSIPVSSISILVFVYKSLLCSCWSSFPLLIMVYSLFLLFIYLLSLDSCSLDLYSRFVSPSFLQLLFLALAFLLRLLSLASCSPPLLHLFCVPVTPPSVLLFPVGYFLLTPLALFLPGFLFPSSLPFPSVYSPLGSCPCPPGSPSSLSRWSRVRQAHPFLSFFPRCLLFLFSLLA